MITACYQIVICYFSISANFLQVFCKRAKFMSHIFLFVIIITFQESSSIMTEDENEWGPELICMFIIIPGLCIVGLLGNILTLAVLTCRLKDWNRNHRKGILGWNDGSGNFRFLLLFHYNNSGVSYR